MEDAIILLLHGSLSHLEKNGGSVRVMFFDLSSAFNTIQAALLRVQLEGAGVDCHLAAWIIDSLTNRPQNVRLRGCESNVLLCSKDVISRNSQMTQQLLAVLQRGMSWSTGGSSPALLNGVEKTSSDEHQ